MTENNNPSEYRGLRIFWAHASISAAMRRRLVQFWLDSGALSDPFEAWRRTFEVGCIVLNGNDQIVGASTVYAARLGESGPPYFFYRTFVRPDCRVSGLSSRVVGMTFDRLAEYAKELGAPRGLVVVAENAKFSRPGARRKLERLGFALQGIGPLGNEVWKRDFY